MKYVSASYGHPFVVKWKLLKSRICNQWPKLKRKQTKDYKILWLTNNRGERKSGRVKEGNTLMTRWEMYTRTGRNSKTETMGERRLCSFRDYSFTPKPCNKNLTIQNTKSKLFTKCIHSTIYSPILILLQDACQVSTRQARRGFLKLYIHRNKRGNTPHNSQHIATDYMTFSLVYFNDRPTAQVHHTYVNHVDTHWNQGTRGRICTNKWLDWEQGTKYHWQCGWLHNGIIHYDLI